MMLLRMMLPDEFGVAVTMPSYPDAHQLPSTMLLLEPS